MTDSINANLQITMEGIGCHTSSQEPVTHTEYTEEMEAQRRKLLDYAFAFSRCREWLYTKSNTKTSGKVCSIREVKIEWEAHYNDLGRLDYYAPVGAILLAARSCGFPMIDRGIDGIVLVDLDPRFLVRGKEDIAR